MSQKMLVRIKSAIVGRPMRIEENVDLNKTMIECQF